MGFDSVWGAAAAEMQFLLFALGSVTGRCLYLGSLNEGCKGWEGSRDNLYLGLPVKGARYKDFVIFVVPSWYCHYSHHLPKEEKCFLGRRGEGGVPDLGLLEPHDGDWNHLPGMSGHWCGSESSSGSEVLQEISNTTGGWSSRGMWEIEAASGSSSPTSITTSSKAACGVVNTGSVSW